MRQLNVNENLREPISMQRLPLSVWLWYAIVLAISLIIAIFTFADIQSIVRGPLAFIFSFTIPGLAWVPLLRFNDLAMDSVFVLGVSVSVTLITSLVILYVDLWSPENGLLILLIVTLLGVSLRTARLLMSGE